MTVDQTRTKVQKIARVLKSLEGAELEGTYYTHGMIGELLFDLGEVGANAVSWTAFRDAGRVVAPVVIADAIVGSPNPTSAVHRLRRLVTNREMYSHQDYARLLGEELLAYLEKEHAK